MENEISLSLRKDIKNLFNEIQERISQLNSLMVDADLDHFIYKIPVRLEEDSIAKTITFATFHREDAWDAAQKSYGQFYRVEKQHHRTTMRLPGVVFVKNIKEVEQEVQSINGLKGQLKALFLSIPTSKRNRIASQTLPGVVLLQLYRHIELFSGEVRRLVFTWVGNTTSSKRVSKKQVETTVNREKGLLFESGIFPNNFTEETWGEALLKLEEVLNSLNEDSVIQLVNPVSPHPRLVLFNDSTTKPIKTIHANLPLIMPPPTKAFKVRGLKPFDSNKEAKTRKDKKQRIRLSPYFNYYVEKH